MKNFTNSIKKFTTVKSLALGMVAFLFSHVIIAQNQVNLPDCTNCATPTSGVASAYVAADGVFPYKVIDIDANFVGGSLLLTENKKVFVLGENGLDGTAQNTSNTDNLIDSPMRMDMPAGILVEKIAKGYTNNMVIGDDGLLYGWGHGFGFAGTAVTTSAISAINLPAGVTQVVELATADAKASSTLIIDSDGKAWFTGQDASQFLPSLPTNAWVEITPPGAGITYTKVWNFARVDGYYNEREIFYFEASDGNYYAMGPNLFHAFGNAGLSGENPNSGFTTINYTQTPIKVDLPAGTVITKFDGDSNITLALSTDGKLYAWGELRFLPTVSGASGTVTTPEEVELPSGGSILDISPTKFTNFSRYYAQCDDGGLYGLYDLNSSIYASDNGYLKKWGPQFSYAMMLGTIEFTSAFIGLTPEGNVIAFGDNNYTPFGFLDPCVSPGCTQPNSPFLLSYFLSDGRFDANNPRPTE